MKKERILVIVAFVCCSFVNLVAESREARQPSISLGTGSMITNNQHFIDASQSRFVFINNLSISFPITNKNLFIFGKVQYGSKESTPLISYSEYDAVTGAYNLTTKRVGASNLNIWNYYLGIQYDFPISDKSLWFVTVGGLSASATEKITGTVYGDLNSSNGALMLFVGAGYEHKVYKKLAAFGEAQYNFGSTKLLKEKMMFDNLNVSVGLRCYFKQ